MGRHITCECGECTKCRSRFRVAKSRVRHGKRWNALAREKYAKTHEIKPKPVVKTDMQLDEECLKWLEQLNISKTECGPRLRLYCQLLDEFAALYGG